jgi:hypothetical protein
MSAANRRRILLVMAIIAILFGGATVFSGANALFGGAAARAAVGDAVPFVLWFNFLAGFFYIAAGAGLVRGARWAMRLSVLLALATLAVAAAFAVHVLTGGAYEMRTVGAMTLRSAFLIALAAIAVYGQGNAGAS